MWDVVNLSARINEWRNIVMLSRFVCCPSRHSQKYHIADHVAIVYDGDECHFYLDGVQTSAQKDTGDIAVRPTDVFIGMPGTGTDHEYFVGLIDGKCAFSAADVLW